MHQPRKRFGQHFLCDQTVIQRIVSALHPQVGEHLIEIGPGQGAITIPVLQIVKRLEVIELDRDLVVELEQRNRHVGELMIHAADVLTVDFSKLKQDARLLRVFGNLPYNISTPLMFHLLSYASVIQDMLFMVQKEVGVRLAAKPGTKDYGRLSVMMQYYCDVEVLFHISPQAFFPPPQVQSSIVRLLPHRNAKHKANNVELFASLVKQAFGQRRKTLRNSLKGMVSDAVWASVPLSSVARPEQWSVSEFVLLANAVEDMS